LAKLSFAAIDSFEKIMISRKFNEADVLRIMTAAKSRNLGPYYVGTNLVLALFEDYPEMEAVWRELTKSKSAHERWVAISILRDERIAENFTMELITNALKDKSSKVRLFAVECVYIRYLSPLFPQLKKMIEIEKDKNVIKSLEWVLSRNSE
jgi:hypothetical protein